MSEIVIFAGTTEGRTFSEWLCENNIKHTVCVATDYGEQVLRENHFARVHQGRMDEAQMIEFLRAEEANIVIDATHPYASIVTENVRNAADKLLIKYLRLDREYSYENVDEWCNSRCKNNSFHTVVFKDSKECAEALKEISGNILLTTGSKELSIFCQEPDVKSRLIVRVLPSVESISICDNAGISGKNIIAMQGPFSVEMNMALMKQYSIDVIVTKASGMAGGFYEKNEAARKVDIPVFIIGRPECEKGISFDEVCKIIRDEYGLNETKKNLDNSQKLNISLIGCGMGHRDSLTVEALEALDEADVVFGASRLLKDMQIEKESYPFYLSKDIIPKLNEIKCDVAILFSGDSGFYSGAKKLCEELKSVIADGSLAANVDVYPGISSISNLAAKAFESWEDANILSVHGKGSVADWAASVLESVRNNRKTFLLLSGVKDLNAIGRLLEEYNLCDCRMIVGFQMSYEEQEILELSVVQCISRVQEGLYSIFIINDNINKQSITTGINDEVFIRGNVPMTKEEVRTVSISKLGLTKDAVVFDIGSGTGSIAVEIAKISGCIDVFAIEKKQEAVELIRQNVEKFNIANVQIVEGEAPEALINLPTPSHAFIGGSGGNIQEIVRLLINKNPNIRIVANAVSYETMQEFLRIEKEYDVDDFEIINMQVTRTREVGSYHMMQSENPVYICSFTIKR